ncbi:hypothetical protein H4R24_002639 [Coemansia sp. RSA 988]|nr:hypothetical protein H4R24_002639 [Coemansia sp. RSA 988]
MNVSTPTGRKQFVLLLVSWFICEEERLGYDPTIHYDVLKRCWEFDAFDKVSQRMLNYKCDSTIQDACSVFGRHTRCFTATLKRKRPADDDPPSSHADKVIIKDSRAQVDKGNICDEVDKKLEDTYPRLEAGAVVQIFGASNRYGEDTTQYIMQGGNGVNSVDELIAVAYDAMVARTAILKRCGIGGILIGFDNPIRTGDVTGPHCPDRTCTLPYMGISNLEKSIVKCTALDDWESLIYLLCWLRAIGVNRDGQNVAVGTD